jgi:hypothetical protein
MRQAFHSTSTQATPSREPSTQHGAEDSYFRRTSIAHISTPLPTNDDWVFRVKVTSSTINPQDEVFEKAVQDLVNICFPLGVLEEIGVDVVERHMREESAPEENIRKMTDVFRAEMIHRISFMLATYLDTPQKVEQGVAAVKAASKKLHEEKEFATGPTHTSTLGNTTEAYDEMLVDVSDQSPGKATPVTTKKHKKRKTVDTVESSEPADVPDGANTSDMDIDDITRADVPSQSSNRPPEREIQAGV